MEMKKVEMDKKEILKHIKERALQEHVPILQDESLELILMVLRLHQPKKILEIGTAVGYSAIQFASCLETVGSNITTIELKENMYEQAVNNITAMGLQDRIEVIHANACEYLETLEEDTYDAIFIDAAKGQYMVFLQHALRCIRDGGVIIADNVLFKGRTLGGYNEHKHRTATNRLRKYLAEIEENEHLTSTLVKVGDGVAISIYQENIDTAKK